MKRILLLLCSSISLVYSRQNDNNKLMTATAAKNDRHTNPLTDSLIIAPVYPDTVYFAVQANVKKQAIVKGNIEGFHDKTSEIHELYFQRFVEKQGTFRVIHCVGSALETTYDFGKEQFRQNKINDTIKFDELGIFAGEPGDPLDLIPLYPGHAVKPGEYWKPEAQVKIPMGYGVAHFSFLIDSLYKDEKNSLVARMQIKVNANLNPTSEFKGGEVTVSGGGWILWDCTINQRRETHLNATYQAMKGQSEVRQLISIDDELQVNKGRKQF